MYEMDGRPQNIPKLENYTPTKFMVETSYYDEKKADRAVTFIQSLKHTKGKWAGKNFWLFPWQEQIIRDIFGVVDKETKKRQFRMAYIEIGKKNGKQVKLDTPIPTPDGWSTMGDLQVGDRVLDECGVPCNVVAKSEVDTTEDAYEIKFGDGSVIIAGARHQWIVDGHDEIVTSSGMAKFQEKITISIGGLKTHEIKSISNIGNGIPMQCIQVDSPSHCYLCGPSMVPTHNSELAAAVALYLLFGDGEASAEVYGCAADRQQASIVFDVAKDMVGYAPALQKRCKVKPTNKRIVNYSLAGFYQVLSAEVGTKHGLNVSGLVFDELHAQPNRRLWDVMTKGSGDAREQPLFFVITTAGTDRNSICYEQHMKAKDIISGRKFDKTFYPVIYGLDDDEDWHDEKNWYKANPSLGLTIDIENVRQWHQEALDNPAEENAFKQLRLNMWVSSLTRFIPEYIFELGNRSIDIEALEGRDCYGGLDLSSTDDITAFVLMFPPREDHPEDEDKYICLPFFWIPEDTIPARVRRASVPYDIWKMKGLLNATEGNVVDYAYIEQFIDDLGNRFKIREIAFDRWGATQVSQDLTRMGFTMAMMGQGYASMSPPTKEFYKLLMEGRIIHGGNEILSWMAGNVVVEQDPAGNIKAAKNKSAEKIDGIVAAIMALDRCIRHEETASVYDDAERGLWIF